MPNIYESVVLVDKHDRVVGMMEKLKAHQLGLLHRAISVFVFNSRGEMLLQRRASNKYHSGGLWTNTCCSHPKEGETVYAAANRRLREEMGLECELENKLSFIYKASFDNGLTEHEFDHVFTGATDELPKPDAKEVGEWKYVSIKEMIQDIKREPQKYTQWFRICIEQYMPLILRGYEHSYTGA